MNRSRFSRRIASSILLLFTLGLVAALSLPTVQAAGLTGSVGPVTILTSDAAALHFVLETPAFVQTAEGQISVDGLTTTGDIPGAPALPIYSTLIALPPGATATLAVRELTSVGGSVNAVPPNPHMQVSRLNEWPLADSAQRWLEYAPDPAIYQTDALYPAQPYALTEPMYQRDLRVARLTLYPVRYNPVQNYLEQATQLDVVITFTGGTDEGGPANGVGANEAMTGGVLNAFSAENWHHFPQPSGHAAQTAGMTYPPGTELYKIEVDHDAVHIITYAALAAAGMNVAAVNPATFELTYRGTPVAYEFLGNPNDGFQSGEALRFYGFAFHGTRTEQIYIKNNVFWLRAGGIPTYITTGSNPTGYPQVTTYQTSFTTDPYIRFFSTWTDQWPTFENEPDSWYWERLDANNKVLNVTLPHPNPTGPDAQFLAEVLSADFYPSTTLSVYMNTHPTPGVRTFSGKFDFNVTGTIPQSQLLAGANSFRFNFSATRTYVYLNRITVDYTRQFIADGDELFFTHRPAGQFEFLIDGFSQSNPANALAFDITNPQAPVRIPVTATDVSAGTAYKYRIGSNHAANAGYLVTTVANVDAPVAVSRYVTEDLNPPTGQADWLAISYADFIPQAQRLAAFRQDPLHGGLRTHVVDAQKVINQYGYGLVNPEAIQAYLLNAMQTWSVPPSYVVLVGDSSQNPRGFSCVPCGSFWGPDNYQLVPTYLLFIDRFQGVIPTDFRFSLLVGNDEVPDLSIGRLPADNLSEITTMVDKIILYENNLLSPSPWMTNIDFVADNTDAGGNFCNEAQQLGASLPSEFNDSYLCLPTGSASDMAALRTQIFNAINNGMLLLNYRGHGSIASWASGLMTTSDTSLWTNYGHPMVIISADCLDGYFVWPGVPSMAESYLKLPNAGSAAHWSSTGLGYLYEYSLMGQGFYEGLFDFGLTAIGDAIRYSKTIYAGSGYHDSVNYAMTLAGDPAMQLMRPDLAVTNAPTESTVQAGQPIDFVVQVTNNGLFPAQFSLQDSYSSDLSFVGAISSFPLTVSDNGGVVTLSAGAALNLGATATITLTFQASPAPLSQTGLTTVTATSPGHDSDPTDNTALASVIILGEVTAVHLSELAIRQANVQAGVWLLLPLGCASLWVARRARRKS